MAKIKYKKGYKYPLYETYIHPLSDELCKAIDMATLDMACHEFISVVNNNLVINEGYAWDGPSGPTIDTKDFMRGSLVHDALYQLMREGYMVQSDRKLADQELARILKEDGMGWFRRWYVYWGVRLFGGPSADPVNRHKVIEAP